MTDWAAQVVGLRDAVVSRLDLGITGAELLPATRRVTEELTRDPQLVAAVMDEIFGLGPLEPLLTDPSVDVIRVDDGLVVERAGVVERVERGFRDDHHVRRMLARILEAQGHVLGDAGPVEITVGPFALRAEVVRQRATFRLQR